MLYRTYYVLVAVLMLGCMSEPVAQSDRREAALGEGVSEGYGQRQRCGRQMLAPSQVYELSHIRDNNMPQSPFAAPEVHTYNSSVGLPFTAHVGNTDTVSGETGGQGTQFDSLGHFGYLPVPWDPSSGPIPVEQALYFGGLTQAEVKPDPNGPLARLGLEEVPPIVTSALLLDAEAHFGHSLDGGELIHAEDIDEMIEEQGLGWRGIRPGDAVLIHTGYGRGWGTDPTYYFEGPGLAYDAAVHLADQGIVLVSLDNPFTDPVNPGQLAGEAPPPAGTLPGLPFSIHHHMLSQAGVYQIQNAALTEIAEDEVWLSCFMALPLRVRGGAQSPVRPIAIGRSR